MPRESIASRRSRAVQLLEALRAVYPEAHCELVYQTPLQLLIATILSAQCTDARVNKVTPALFQRCGTAADFVEIPREELEHFIHSTGFYRAKAKNIQGCCRALMERHGGEVPRTLGELTSLPGVGRKTANVVLAEVFNHCEGVVVDTHVLRLSKWFRWAKGSQAESVERELMALLPDEHWLGISHWLIWHGRRRCSARHPDCERCEVRDLCPSRATKG